MKKLKTYTKQQIVVKFHAFINLKKCLLMSIGLVRNFLNLKTFLSIVELLDTVLSNILLVMMNLLFNETI